MAVTKHHRGQEPPDLTVIELSTERGRTNWVKLNVQKFFSDLKTILIFFFCIRRHFTWIDTQKQQENANNKAIFATDWANVQVTLRVCECYLACKMAGSWPLLVPMRGSSRWFSEWREPTSCVMGAGLGNKLSGRKKGGCWGLWMRGMKGVVWWCEV